MKKWLFNPFIYIAGTKALFIGVLAMALTAFISSYSRVHFDGVIDIHIIGHDASLTKHFLEQLIDWSVLTTLFYIAGLLISGSAIRFIDVAGTLALARWVMVFPALIGFTIHVSDKKPENINEILSMITPAFILSGLFIAVFAIWMIALYFNAIKVSCNLKGAKATVTFIAGLIIAEVIASLLIHNYL